MAQYEETAEWGQRGFEDQVMEHSWMDLQGILKEGEGVVGTAWARGKSGMGRH